MKPLAPIAVAALLLACPEPPEVATQAPCALLFGDVAFSELMTDPAEAGGAAVEWFELYNTKDQSVSLARAVLERVSVGEDGVTKISSHNVRTLLSIEAHGHLVVALGSDAFTFVDYSVGSDLGSLTNTGGTLQLLCQGQIIDRIVYGGGDIALAEKGHSLSFDGGVAPDALINDSPEYWCAAGDPYDEVNVGSPGRGNVSCGYAACEDEAGLLREVVAPRAGELVISEVFPDPIGADAAKEWLELYVASDRALDLNGLQIDHHKADTDSVRSLRFDSIPCLTARPQTYVVVGASLLPEENGGVAADFALPRLSFFNDAILDISVTKGHEVIDYAQIPKGREGMSLSLAAAPPVASGNDMPEAFCQAQASGAFEGKGTPGAANLCGESCVSGNGQARPPLTPRYGELVITEIHANPSGADNDRDWLELYVTASSPVDLNGLVLVHVNAAGNERRWTLSHSACLSAAPGSYVVVGGANAGQDMVQTLATISGSGLLYNAAASLTLQTGAGEVIDAAQHPLPGDGKTLIVPPDVLEAEHNNVATDWCTSPVVADGRAFTETGSPGARNDPCP